jgi:hypothetical protein
MLPRALFPQGDMLIKNGVSRAVIQPSAVSFLVLSSEHSNTKQSSEAGCSAAYSSKVSNCSIVISGVAAKYD